MADQKQFRSESARKNYEKHERQRANAAKRKATKAKQDALISQATQWLKVNRSKVIVAAAIIVMVVLAICAVSALHNPLKGKQDNWLIINTSNTTSGDYRHLANFEIPEGYTLDDYSSYSDDTTQDFFCIADDRTAIVQDLYISGSKALKAAEFPTTVLSYNLHKAAGEPRQLTVAGKACHAVYLVTDESEYYGEGLHMAHMSFYFDTDEGACITATFRSNMMLLEELPDEATMLAEAERLLANLTLVK